MSDDVADSEILAAPPPRDLGFDKSETNVQ